ncbi:MAG: VCBS repeat-containing protein [Saprospiraceae bacterium]
MFGSEPEQTGITFIQDISETFEYSFINDPSVYNGGGVAVIDYDNDGLQDLFFSSRQKSCRLYHNLGGMKFEEVTDAAGVAAADGLKTGVAILDINADGYLDIYLCRTGLKPSPSRENILFINQGNGTFVDQAKAFGLNDISPSQCVNFLDYDLDGDLDMYLVNQPTDNSNINNIDFIPGKGKTVRGITPRVIHDTDRFYRNNGDNTFTDISKEAGIWNRAWGLSVTSADFNEDGYPDLYVGNDFIMPDFVYINDRKGGFVDEGDSWFRHFSNHTMGVDIADLNNDGLLDVVTADMISESWVRRKKLMSSMMLDRYKLLNDKGYGYQMMRNTLQINDGNGSFSEVGCLAGMYATDWSWATLLADFDNDGWKDLFISNGIKRDLNDLDFLFYKVDSINRSGGINKARYKSFDVFAEQMPSHKAQNYMYRNNGSLCLEDVSKSWGLEEPRTSNGAIYADLDNDGDLDLVANAVAEPATVYENKAVQMGKSHWLQIKCKGPATNLTGIGAKVRVQFEDFIFYQEMTPYRGFYSSVEPIMQVGLGSRTQPVRVEVEWPGGTYQLVENVKADQRLVLDAADATPGKLPPVQYKDAGIKFELASAPALKLQENAFEDFDRERLMTHRLSRQGPCMAVTDLNGDGLDDVFIGAPLGQASKVYLQSGSGRFTAMNQPALDADAKHEDLGAVWFDADGDGDQDLYVASGSNESPNGSENYIDRLYINKGNGVLERDFKAIPILRNSTKAVLACDLDGDGDQDLLVGGRGNPGNFPLPSSGSYFENDGSGKFTDVTKEKAAIFEEIGMVTSMAYADLNGDKKPEIILAGEWMPITILQWNGTTLEDATAAFGLEKSGGWWKTLCLADMDKDGDLDIIAGNIGLNTRYEASAEAPMKVFAKDFDGNGSMDPLVTVAFEGRYVTTVMRDHWAMQIGAGNVKKNFPRHTKYAEAAITDVWSPEALKSSYIRETHTLATSWFENKNGQFIQHVLPSEAQVAPVFAIVHADFNNDGFEDLLLMGNDSGMEVETARMDASNGCLLLGDKAGRFTYEPNFIHGLWASKEVRSAALMNSGGDRLILIGNNNDAVQAWKQKSVNQ